MNRQSPLDSAPGRYWAWRKPATVSDATRPSGEAQRRIRLAIVSTHPIQYHSPWFRALARLPQIDLHVYYCHRAAAEEQGAGFGVAFSWDIPLLSGYSHSFLKNAASSPSLAGFNGLNTPEIVSIIADHRHDIVLVNGWHYRSAWQAMRACWSAQVPVIARSDSHLHSPRSLWKKAVKDLPFRFFIPRLNGCAAVGAWSREYFSHYGAPPERIVEIPHVVDLDRLRAQEERWRAQRASLQERWGLRPDAFTFVFAGKFVPKKHPVDAIQAVVRAFRDGVKVQLLMAGEGPLRKQCEAEAQKLEAPVRFTGFLNQSEIVSAYCATDALVLPSDGGETWGLVVNEAMACGLPCIVSDRVGCGPDLIANRGTGAIVPLNDVEKLASTMAAWAADREKVAQMSVAARQLSPSFAPEAAANATATACEALVRQQALPLRHAARNASGQ